MFANSHQQEASDSEQEHLQLVWFVKVLNLESRVGWTCSGRGSSGGQVSGSVGLSSCVG